MGSLVSERVKYISLNLSILDTDWGIGSFDSIMPISLDDVDLLLRAEILIVPSWADDFFQDRGSTDLTARDQSRFESAINPAKLVAFSPFHKQRLIYKRYKSKIPVGMLYMKQLMKSR